MPPKTRKSPRNKEQKKLSSTGRKKAGTRALKEVHSMVKPRSPPRNLSSQFCLFQYGMANQWKKHGRNVLVKSFSDYKACCSHLPFPRRVTVLQWHPCDPKTLVVCSKGGDVLLWKVAQQPVPKSMFSHGIGAGGSILAFKITRQNDMYSCSMEGVVCKWTCEADFVSQVLLHINSNDRDAWFTSLDVDSTSNLFAVGDNVGKLILAADGQKVIFKDNLHKRSKISHVEFHPQDKKLLVTASVDHTVKLWDLRCMKKDSSLLSIKHSHAINSAYFSRTGGSRLLATDQADGLYVYAAPTWDLETHIKHPHRQFQHLTPIKASWHPLVDIIVVGRYPQSDCEDELRTIDLFDAEKGELLYQIYDPSCKGIYCLNEFNCCGSALASSTGNTTRIWLPRQKGLPVASCPWHL